jgi:hypothetical protein
MCFVVIAGYLYAFTEYLAWAGFTLILYGKFVRLFLVLLLVTGAVVLGFSAVCWLSCSVVPCCVVLLPQIIPLLCPVALLTPLLHVMQCVRLAGSPGKCWFKKRTKVQYICMPYL